MWHLEKRPQELWGVGVGTCHLGITSILRGYPCRKILTFWGAFGNMTHWNFTDLCFKPVGDIYWRFTFNCHSSLHTHTRELKDMNELWFLSAGKWSYSGISQISPLMGLPAIKWPRFWDDLIFLVLKVQFLSISWCLSIPIFLRYRYS